MTSQRLSDKRVTSPWSDVPFFKLYRCCPCRRSPSTSQSYTRRTRRSRGGQSAAAICGATDTGLQLAIALRVVHSACARVPPSPTCAGSPRTRPPAARRVSQEWTGQPVVARVGRWTLQPVHRSGRKLIGDVSRVMPTECVGCYRWMAVPGSFAPGGRLQGRQGRGVTGPRRAQSQDRARRRR